MNVAEILIKYNGFLLIFSATGFLFSLLWVFIHEKRQRKVDIQKQLKKMDIFDEKVFFGEFDHLENPAKTTSSHKTIFENTLTEEEKIEFDNDNLRSSEVEDVKYNKAVGLPKFPTLKKELDQKLNDSINVKMDSSLKLNPKKDSTEKKQSKIITSTSDQDEEQVKGLLDKIKKDLRNRKD